MRNVRRISQILFLLFFFYLFLIASYPLNFPVPADLFLRADPLLALSSMMAVRNLIPTFWISLVLIILTIPLGRVFCGWVCPLGTTLDTTSYIFRNPVGRKTPKLRLLKYTLLILILVSAIFSSQLVWILDPIVLYTRTLTISLFPLLTFSTYSLFGLLFRISFLQDFLTTLQTHLASTILPNQLSFFRMSTLILLIFLVILSLEFVSRRFWCRNPCPLGALYSFFSKLQIWKRKVKKGCNDCADCVKVCKMDAIEDDFINTKFGECIQCYNCVADCPNQVTSLSFRNKPKTYSLSLTRRRVVVAGILGVLFSGVLKISFLNKNARAELIRPPGAREEEEFLKRCIRCHKCIRVCSTSGNFLQPAILEGGWEGFWTPVGYARGGYCEYNCTMCTHICPSGAIHPLDEKTKKKTIIGLAYIDRNRCLPWYKNQDCVVCEEHCPIPQKAIDLKSEKVIDPEGKVKMIKRPYVKEDLCIGCGICETKCPIQGRSAIIVTSQGEQRWTEGK